MQDKMCGLYGNMYELYDQKVQEILGSIFGEHKVKYNLFVCIVDTDRIHFESMSSISYIPSTIVYPKQPEEMKYEFCDYRDICGIFSNDEYECFMIPIKNDNDFSIVQIDKQEISGLTKYRYYKLCSCFGDKAMSECSGISFFNEYCSELCCKSVDAFKKINSISLLGYEGAQAKGYIILASIGTVCFSIEFIDPVAMSEHRKIRKLLEISTSHLMLVSDGSQVYGFAEYNVASQSGSYVKISGPEAWELHCNGRLEFYVKEESFFDSERNPKDIFNNLFISFFGINNTESQWEIVQEASKQSHGTMIVFSEDAYSESKRLSKSSFMLKPTRNLSLIQHISSIDGAILLDLTGMIHSIGVILDGIVSEDMNRSNSRGARYNSAIVYSHNHSNKCIIVVVSEDGYLNILANGAEQT